MSKITVSLLSMTVGFAFGLSFSGNHAVTIAQARGVFGPTAPPVIPPISARYEDAQLRGNMGLSPQPIDGLGCKNCDFEDIDIEYSGGNLALENIKFGGKQRLILSGAAANTLRFVAFWQATTSGQKPEPINPNAPIMKSASLAKPIFASFKTQ